jgi:hypothetical protein
VRFQVELSRTASTAKELLASDPAKAGEHISKWLWRLDLAPLRFQYEINFAEHVVTINNISLLVGHELT